MVLIIISIMCRLFMLEKKTFKNEKQQEEYEVKNFFPTQLCHLMFFWKLSCEQTYDVLLKTEFSEGA